MAEPKHKSWSLPDRAVTDETVALSRRRFIAALGLGGLAAGAATSAARFLAGRARDRALAPRVALPASRNPRFAVERPLTPVDDVLRYTNFYEFGTDKRAVWWSARDFELRPYELVIDGLVERPGALGLDQVEALGLEERVLRFRCVEAWAMTVPWTGVPLAKLLGRAGPLSDARFVRFESFDDPKQAPGQRVGAYPFPYYEALRIDEALHPLAFVATGLYGARLAPQNGAPLRLVVPWKYGFKSAKSLVRITLTAERPPTFWNDLQPGEYSWLANVDPVVPHPRWSQAHERLLGSGDRVPTRPFNGYGPEVGGLYA